jgi:hypothetical protein
MRIEIIRQLHPIERERYEFIVRVVSRGIYIHLASYKAERRQSIRHRSYLPHKVWFDSLNDDRACSYLCTRLTTKPSVPLEVEADMHKHLYRSIHQEFSTIPV